MAKQQVVMTEENKIIEPPDFLDNARVVKWAWSGQTPFGYVGNEYDKKSEAIYGLAICRYEDGDKIYRFSCNSNWETVQDSVYDTIDQAIECLPDQYKNIKADWQIK